MSIDAFTVAEAADRSGRPVSLGASRNTVKVSSKDTAGALAIFEYEGGERGGPPLHVHEAQDEMFFVQEGAYLFHVGSADHRLRPGETIFLPRGIPHQLMNVSGQPTRYILLCTPSGFEGFVAEGGTLRQPGQRVMPPTADDIRRIRDAAPRYGITLLPGW